MPRPFQAAQASTNWKISAPALSSGRVGQRGQRRNYVLSEFAPLSPALWASRLRPLPRKRARTFIGEASGHRVAGTLSGGGKAAIAWLTPKGGATSLILRSAAKIQPDGSFAFPGVAAGAYILSATEADGVTTAAAPVAVTVAQKDLEGLELRAHAGAELSGEVALGANNVPLPVGMQVILETADAPLPRPARAAVDEHGKFTFAGLAPGRYMVHVIAPQELYVRSARYRGVDVAETPLDFGGGTSAPLLIGLSAGGASLGGTVRGPDGRTCRALL